jgi:hypothetical protein
MREQFNLVSRLRGDEERSRYPERLMLVAE